MAVLNSVRIEDRRRNESFRRRPRKSNKPCRAWMNSTPDEYRFSPFSIGEKVAIKKNDGESQKIKIIFKKKSAQLPVEFKNYIRELGATRDPVLVIEKKLFQSDVSPVLHRLSIPVKQVVNHEFLSEEEKKRFNSGNKTEKIDAILVEPSLAQSKIKFKKWYVNDCGMYVLMSGWNEVVKRNGLEPGTLVQLWSFKKGLQLYFALVIRS